MTTSIPFQHIIDNSLNVQSDDCPAALVRLQKEAVVGVVVEEILRQIPVPSQVETLNLQLSITPEEPWRDLELYHDGEEGRWCISISLDPGKVNRSGKSRRIKAENWERLYDQRSSFTDRQVYSGTIDGYPVTIHVFDCEGQDDLAFLRSLDFRPLGEYDLP